MGRGKTPTVKTYRYDACIVIGLGVTISGSECCWHKGLGRRQALGLSDPRKVGPPLAVRKHARGIFREETRVGE